MTERKILYTTPMVQFILDGHKRATSRLSNRWAKVKAGDRLWIGESFRYVGWPGDGHEEFWVQYRDGTKRILTKADIATYTGDWDDRFLEIWRQCSDECEAAGVPYDEDDINFDFGGEVITDDDGVMEYKENDPPTRWRGGMYMPKACARRLRLEVVDVKRLHVQSLSYTQIRMEGCAISEDATRCFFKGRPEFGLPRDAWIDLWNSINDKPKPAKRNPAGHKEDCLVVYPYAQNAPEVQKILTGKHAGKNLYTIGNPMVWHITFKKVLAPKEAGDHNRGGVVG